jgi:hypothetical protein
MSKQLDLINSMKPGGSHVLCSVIDSQAVNWHTTAWINKTNQPASENPKMARQVGYKQYLKIHDERMLIVMKESTSIWESTFLLISKYIEYKLRLIRQKMPCQSLIQEKFKPTNIAIPNNATVVPIKKLVAGFVLRNT